MSYQTTQQFAPNRLTEEAAQAAELAAAQTPVDQATAVITQPIESPARARVAGPSPTTASSQPNPPVEEVIDQKLIHRLAVAAKMALASNGNPERIKELEDLIGL